MFGRIDHVDKLTLIEELNYNSFATDVKGNILLNDLFDNVYLINLERRQDRLNRSRNMLDALGIKYQVFKGHDAKSDKSSILQHKQIISNQDLSEKYVAENFGIGAFGCLKSHINVVKDAIEKNYKSILILEDDVLFHRNFNIIFELYMEHLPDDWDFFYLGKKTPFFEISNLKKFNDYWSLPNFNVWATHSIAIKDTIYEAVLDMYSIWCGIPVDVLLHSLYDKYNFYCADHDLAVTLCGDSDIQMISDDHPLVESDPYSQWGWEIDYYLCFRHYSLDWGKKFLAEINELYEIEHLETHNLPVDEIHGLWAGESLSNIEILSIRSYLINGYKFNLWTYNPIDNIPALPGLTVRDANEILPLNNNLPVNWFSDYFRYKLLYEKGGIYSDLDVICLRNFALKNHMPYVFAGQKSPLKHSVCGNVLVSPQKSLLMKRLISFCEENIDRDYFGQIGPELLTFVVRLTRYKEYLMPFETFNPVNWDELEFLFDPCFDYQAIVHDEKINALHLWNKMWHDLNLSRVAKKENNMFYYLNRIYGSSVMEEPKIKKFDLYTIDQLKWDDTSWRDLVESMESLLHNEKGVLVECALEDSFYWKTYERPRRITESDKNWIGFSHHPPPHPIYHVRKQGVQGMYR